MIWEDKGYLISKNKYNENSVIVEFFTENHGKISGIVFGGTSKKIKGFLIIGNRLHLNYNTKQDGRIGNFKIEIDKVLTPFFFENNKKLSCVVTSMNLIKILTVESQQNKDIYYLIKNLFEILNEQDWLKSYIYWELEFYKIIGYDLNLKNIVSNEIINGKKIYFVKSNSEKKIIPNFLIDKNDITNKSDLFNGLKLVGDYLEKSILKPNNIFYNNFRSNFVNLFK